MDVVPNQVKHIVEGFEDDFINIVNNFSTFNPDLKFLEFLKYWSQESLDTLFANRFDPRELLESISNLNQILVRILVNYVNEDDKYSVVALYFLLATYVKQPERFRRKIRLTCQDAIYIQNLTTKSTTSSYGKDIEFVWKQLRRIGSIDLVEEHVIYGPSMLVSSKSNNTKKTNDNTSAGSANLSNNPLIELHKDATEFLESKIEPALIGFETMLAPYEQLKESLKLDEYKEQTGELDEQKTNIDVWAQLDRAKSLLSTFKAASPLD